MNKNEQRKPAAFRRPSKRTQKLERYATASEAIGEIKKGSDTYILTFGQFSLIDALLVILDQAGPSSVVLSTWTAADAHLERTAEMIEAAKITDFRMIVDRSFETRQPKYCHNMRKKFGAECLRAIRTHAKFMIVRSPKLDVVVRTSMNLNENPRLENIEISEGKEFAEFFQSITDDIFAEVGERENRSKLLELKGVPNGYPFKEIQANRIERNNVNEAKTEFTLEKL